MKESESYGKDVIICMGIEIEKKYLVADLPGDLKSLPYHKIEQGYLNVHPAIRVRREDDIFYMTYKGAHSEKEGEIGQVEYNMPLDEESYMRLSAKAEGNVIRKKRYLVPLNTDAYSEEYLSAHTGLKNMLADGEVKIELDVFEEPFEGRIIAEVEFPDEESAAAYKPAEWFAEEVTGDVRYSNAHMSIEKID